MEIQTLKRVFLYDGQELDDPDPNASPETVLDVYSAMYPEMVTAVVVEKEIDEKKGIIKYEISSNLGTKG